MNPLPARYESLFDIAPVGYLVLDEKCTVLFANKFCAGLLGTDPNNHNEPGFLPVYFR